MCLYALFFFFISANCYSTDTWGGTFLVSFVSIGGESHLICSFGHSCGNTVSHDMLAAIHPETHPDPQHLDIHTPQNTSLCYYTQRVVTRLR